MITIQKVWFDNNKIFIELNDGRTIGTPISWYLRLDACPKQQQNKTSL